MIDREEIDRIKREDLASWPDWETRFDTAVSEADPCRESPKLLLDREMAEYGRKGQEATKRKRGILKPINCKCCRAKFKRSGQQTYCAKDECQEARRIATKEALVEYRRQRAAGLVRRVA